MSEAPIAASPLNVGVIHHDSLWMRCFWVIARQNSAEGRESIKFCDVDDLVLAVAKLPPAEHQAWMMDNAIGQRGAACGASAAPTGCASNGTKVSAGETAAESAPARDIHAELTLAAFHREVAK